MLSAGLVDLSLDFPIRFVRGKPCNSRDSQHFSKIPETPSNSDNPRHTHRYFPWSLFMTLVSFNLHKESPLPSLGEKAKQIQNFSFVFFAICLRQRALVSVMWLPCSASSLVRAAQHSLRLRTSLSAPIVHTPSAYRVSRDYCWRADCLWNYQFFLVLSIEKTTCTCPSLLLTRKMRANVTGIYAACVSLVSASNFLPSASI